MKTFFSDEKVYYLENHDFNQNMQYTDPLKQSKPTVVMVMGSFCGHCKDSIPMFTTFSKQNPQVMSAVIMVDGNKSEQTLSQRLKTLEPRLSGVPAFLLFDKDGNYVGMYEGKRNAKDLKKFVDFKSTDK